MLFRVGITAASYHYANMGQHPLTFLMLVVLSTIVSGLSVHNSTGLRAIPARSSPERHDELAAGGSSASPLAAAFQSLRCNFVAATRALFVLFGQPGELGMNGTTMDRQAGELGMNDTTMDEHLLPNASRHVNTKTKTADWMVEYPLDDSKLKLESVANPVRASVLMALFSLLY